MKKVSVKGRTGYLRVCACAAAIVALLFWSVARVDAADSGSGVTAQPTGTDEAVLSKAGMESGILMPTGFKAEDAGGVRKVWRQNLLKASAQASGVSYEIDSIEDWEAYMAVGGRVKWSAMDLNKSSDWNDQWNGNVQAVAGVKVGALSADIKLNFEQELTENIYKGMAASGEVLVDEGLVKRRAKQLLEQLRFVVRLGRITDAQGNPLVEVAAVFGRDSVMPIMEYVYFNRPGTSPLVIHNIDQVDTIKLNMKILNSTIIELAFYDLDVFGNWNDDSGIERGGKGSFSASLRQSLGSRDGKYGQFDFYFAYAFNKEGLVQMNRSLNRQLGEHHLLAAGFIYGIGRLSFGFNNVLALPTDKDAGQSNEYQLEAFVAYDIIRDEKTGKPVLAIAAVYDYSKSNFKDESGHQIGLYLDWAIVENVHLRGGPSYVHREDGSDSVRADIELQISPAAYNLTKGKLEGISENGFHH